MLTNKTKKTIVSVLETFVINQFGYGFFSQLLNEEISTIEVVSSTNEEYRFYHIEVWLEI